MKLHEEIARAIAGEEVRYSEADLIAAGIKLPPDLVTYLSDREQCIENCWREYLPHAEAIMKVLMTTPGLTEFVKEVARSAGAVKQDGSDDPA